METNSDSQNPPPNKMRLLLEMLQEHHVIRNTYRSRSSVANLEHTSLTLRSLITKASITARGRTTTISLPLRVFQTDPLMLLA